MLITDRFVMLNFPKTGSTFARSVIRELVEEERRAAPPLRRIAGGLGLVRGPVCRDLKKPPLVSLGTARRPNQHGAWVQIPRPYRALPVVSVMRDPESWFLSRYAFGWWKRQPPLPADELKRHFPRFPDLDLDEFLELDRLRIARALGWRPGAGPDVGLQTVTLLAMFAHHPTRVLEGLDDAFLDSDRVEDELAPVTWLRQEHLAEDLGRYLVEAGYPEDRVRALCARDRINTSDYGPDGRNSWPSAALRKALRRSERLVYRLMSARGLLDDTTREPGGRLGGIRGAGTG